MAVGEYRSLRIAGDCVMCYVLRVTVKRLDGGGGVSSTACSGVSLASHCGSIGRLCAREYRFAVEDGGALASHC